ncbi:Major allergen Mal d 1 [Bienertia sinuspersici]
MGVYTFTIVDETSPVAPHRLFMAMSIDNHNFMPMATPQSFKGAQLVEGDSTVVGAVKTFFSVEGAPFTYVTIKIDEIDADNYYIKYTNTESDFFGESIDRVVYDAKIDPVDSGSHYKLVADFHTKGDIVVTYDDLKTILQGMLLNYKGVVEYLCNNPEVYA